MSLLCMARKPCTKVFNLRLYEIPFPKYLRADFLNPNHLTSGCDSDVCFSKCAYVSVTMNHLTLYATDFTSGDYKDGVYALLDRNTKDFYEWQAYDCLAELAGTTFQFYHNHDVMWIRPSLTGSKDKVVPDVNERKVITIP